MLSNPWFQNIGENDVDIHELQTIFKKKKKKKIVNYHEMRIQTSHLLECQSPLTSPMVDLPLTRMGLTVLRATASVFHMRLAATHNKPLSQRNNYQVDARVKN